MRKGRFIPLLFLVTLIAPICGSAAEASDQESNRLTVAFVGFANETGDPAAVYWRFAGELIVARELGVVKALRMAPGISYALGQLNKKEGDVLDVAQARKVGEIIEARRVVWGGYRRQGDKWLVSARVLNVATGTVSKALSADSTDWVELGDRIAEQILKELEVEPAPEEHQEMLRHYTKSPAALEWLCKASALYDDQKPHAEVEKCVRSAMEADPRSPEAQTFLAATLGSQGRMEEAVQAVHSALESRPDYAMARRTLGIILLMQGKYDAAEKELRTAARLDPDDAETCERLGELYEEKTSPKQAADYFERAVRLVPFSARYHARLGAFHASQGKREPALAELKEGERLASADYDKDVGVEQSLARGYDGLKEVPSAIAHYEKLVTLGRKQGLNPEMVDQCEKTWRELQARLTPVYTTAARPKDYTEPALQAALRAQLAPEELSLVINPLESTPEMDRWAKELTASGTNQLAKAKMLFEALSHRVENGPLGHRTAREVFADWNKAGSAFYCQEYAFLYVTLARAAGIKAFYVLVTKECDGNIGPHACAGVFIGDKALLVDPAYYWFGVPHQEFNLMDDLHAVALHLSQFGDLARGKVACKLVPDLAFVQFNSFLELMRAGRWKEARQRLSTALRLDSTGYMSDSARAEWAQHENKLAEATGLLKKTLATYPSDGRAHYVLGEIYEKQGKFSDARIEFRTALGCPLELEFAEAARLEVARINERVGDVSADSELDPVTATGRASRGYEYLKQGKFDEAIADFTEAIRTDSRDSRFHTFRGYAYQLKGDKDNAAMDYDEALRLNPKDTIARKFRKALGANHPADSAGDAKSAVQTARKVCETTQWKKWSAIDMLAGAYAKAGGFDQAIKYEKQALALEGVNELNREGMRRQHALYEQRQAKQPPPAAPPKAP